MPGPYRGGSSPARDHGMNHIHALPLLACLALAACGGARDGDGAGDVAAAAGNGTAEPLPTPGPAIGPVTGMPDGPGPGDVPLAGTPTVTPATSPDGTPMVVPIPGMDPADGLPPLEEEPEAGLGEVAPPVMTVEGVPASGPVPPSMQDALADGEPSPADAVAVVRDYYAAIAARDHARAYGLWSDGGRSSGQTPQQFAAGFADTRTVRVQPGEPGRVEGAAGSRYVEVPVSVTTTHADGREQRYVGTYVLRRAVVDGASAAQRSWRIASAELREYRP